MRAKIVVASRREAEEIRAGLEDKDVLAFVKVVGVLRRLDSDAARGRILVHIASHLKEQFRLRLRQGAPADE